MTDRNRYTGRRARTALGLVVVAASFAVAAAVAGIGFAGSSITAAQYQYGKVTICHHTKSTKHPTRTIVVSRNALRAHLRHGDTEGTCAEAAAQAKAKHEAAAAKGHGKPAPAPTTATQTTSSSGGAGHGNAGGNGNGKGHGK